MTSGRLSFELHESLEVTVATHGSRKHGQPSVHYQSPPNLLSIENAIAAAAPSGSVAEAEGGRQEAESRQHALTLNGI